MTTPTTALAGKKQKVEQAFSLVFLGFPKRTQDLVNASEFHLVLADFTALADRIIGEREARVRRLEAALRLAESHVALERQTEPCAHEAPAGEHYEDCRGCRLHVVGESARAALEDA